MWGTGTNRERGFTLLELLVVIALIGVLTSIGAQTTFLPAMSLDRLANKVEGRLHAARQQARESGRSVTVSCPERENVASVTCQRGLDGEAALTFYPDGSSNAAGIELRDGKRHIFISVDWLSGEIARES